MIETVRERREGGGRRPRIRTKAIRSLLVAQLEKLFCAGGLERNRKLKGLIKDCPLGYVDLKLIREVFGVETGSLSPKAIKALGETSSVFQISEDGLQVRQRPNVASSEDCTIFIDNLPSEADETWLIENFERFGTVARAEVPKPRGNFSTRSRNRGFGFIEFVSVNASSTARKNFARSSPEEIHSSKSAGEAASLSGKAEAENTTTLRDTDSEKAGELVGKESRLLSPPPSSPTQLSSPTGSDKITSPGSGKGSLKRKRKSGESDGGSVANSRVQEGTAPVSKFRRKGAASDSTTVGLPTTSDDQSTGEQSNQPQTGTNALSTQKKKRTRRKRTHQRNLRSVQDTKAKSKREKQMKEFMVLSLREWKDLKAEYLKIQKANMAKAKEIIRSHHIPIKLTPEEERNVRGRCKVEMKASITVERSLPV